MSDLEQKLNSLILSGKYNGFTEEMKEKIKEIQEKLKVMGSVNYGLIYWG